MAVMCGNGKSCDECERGPCGPSSRMSPTEWHKVANYCQKHKLPAHQEWAWGKEGTLHIGLPKTESTSAV